MKIHISVDMEGIAGVAIAADTTPEGRDVQGVFLNGEPAGELRLNAALAGRVETPATLRVQYTYD